MRTEREGSQEGALGGARPCWDPDLPGTSSLKGREKYISSFKPLA